MLCRNPCPHERFSDNRSSFGTLAIDRYCRGPYEGYVGVGQKYGPFMYPSGLPVYCGLSCLKCPKEDRGRRSAGLLGGSCGLSRERMSGKQVLHHLGLGI